MQNKTKANQVTAAVNACAASEHYADMFASLRHPDPLSYQNNDRAISKALYFHLAKIKYAGWKHRVSFHRARKHSIADIFQDLLAFYLRCALSDRGVEIVLEPQMVGEKGKRIHPDILVRRDGRNICVIEVKTTIGFARPDETQEDKYFALSQRLKDVARAAKVDETHAFYIFEEPANVTRAFRDAFWDKEKSLMMPRDDLTFPLSQIYPLFWGTDPYYWVWYKKKGKRVTQEEKGQWCPDISDTEFLAEAENRIVTPLEDVVARIVEMELAVQ